MSGTESSDEEYADASEEFFPQRFRNESPQRPLFRPFEDDDMDLEEEDYPDEESMDEEEREERERERRREREEREREEREERERERLFGENPAHFLPPQMLPFLQQFMQGGALPPEFLQQQNQQNHQHNHQQNFDPFEDEDDVPAPDADHVTIEVHEFLEAFEAQYGHVHPPFYVGSFEDAKSTARQAGKFLCIYLHHGTNQEADVFCRQVFCEEGISNLIGEHFVIWGWDVSTPDRMASLRRILRKHISGDLGLFLPAHFPFLAFLAVINGSLTLLDSSMGFIAADDLMVKLLILVENHSRVLEEEQLRLGQREAERRHREQLLIDQENEYLRSLEEDRQKEVQRQEEQKRKEEEEKKEKEKAQHEGERRERLRRTLPEEPSPNCGEGISKLLFRFPDGRKQQRSFLASTPLQVLFDFLEVEGCPLEKGFVCQTNFPKRIVSALDPVLTLREANLFPQETLFVHPS